MEEIKREIEENDFRKFVFKEIKAIYKILDTLVDVTKETNEDVIDISKDMIKMLNVVKQLREKEKIT